MVVVWTTVWSCMKKEPDLSFMDASTPAWMALSWTPFVRSPSEVIFSLAGTCFWYASRSMSLP